MLILILIIDPNYFYISGSIPLLFVRMPGINELQKYAEIDFLIIERKV